MEFQRRRAASLPGNLGAALAYLAGNEPCQRLTSPHLAPTNPTTSRDQTDHPDLGLCYLLFTVSPSQFLYSWHPSTLLKGNRQHNARVHIICVFFSSFAAQYDPLRRASLISKYCSPTATPPSQHHLQPHTPNSSHQPEHLSSTSQLHLLAALCLVCFPNIRRRHLFMQTSGRLRLC